jgi:hypothetical protein
MEYGIMSKKEPEMITREPELYEAALAVEQDEQLRAEMAEWELTMRDGIEAEVPRSEVGEEKCPGTAEKDIFTI